MGETPNVVSIRGGQSLARLEVQADVVEALEAALERARAGDIVGIAAAYVHRDEATSGCLHGCTGRGAIGMLHVLLADMVDRERGK